MPHDRAPQRIVQGIECPRCGHGTYVGKTTNLVSWLHRIRTCKNPACRFTFETKEVLIDPLEKRSPGLFG